MAIKLNGSVSVRRISEHLLKVLSQTDLDNYKILIDNYSDPESMQVSLSDLRDAIVINNEPIYIPEVQPELDTGIINLNCENMQSCMFEPQKETGIIPIDVNFALNITNTFGTQLISCVLQLTGSIDITLGSNVLCSNPSSSGSWDNGTKILSISAGTADIIEFQFLKYNTSDNWMLKVSEIPIT